MKKGNEVKWSFKYPNLKKHPKVLLVGNGINLPFEGAKRTESLIRDIWKEYRGDSQYPNGFENLTFPYQAIVASKDNVGDCVQRIKEYYTNLTVTDEQVSFIRSLLNLRFDAILTTNYSLEFEKSTLGNAKIHPKIAGDSSIYRENLWLYRYVELPYANNPLLWHIHGTSTIKDSIVLDQNYYGKLLAAVVKRSNDFVGKS